MKFFSDNRIDIIKVEAGSRHSLALSSDGHVYGFGLNSSEVRFELRTHIPTQVESIKFKMVDIFAGEDHSVGVSKSGVPYQWEGA